MDPGDPFMVQFITKIINGAAPIQNRIKGRRRKCNLTQSEKMGRMGSYANATETRHPEGMELVGNFGQAYFFCNPNSWINWP
jgi:hypothetical protein